MKQCDIDYFVALWHSVPIQMSHCGTYDGEGYRFEALWAELADVLNTGWPITSIRFGARRSSLLGACPMSVGTMCYPVTKTPSSLAHSTQKRHPSPSYVSQWDTCIEIDC